MPLNTPPAFKPAVAPIALGAAGTVLTSNGTSASTPPTFQPASRGVGAAITFASPSGVIDPAITGFVAGSGAAGTGRVKVTLSANTSWEGLPAGADGQQLFVTIVGGAFTLTFLRLDGLTSQTQIVASADTIIQLNDTIQLVYDSGLGKWLLVS